MGRRARCGLPGIRRQWRALYSWNGKKIPEKELAYRLITEQLPINFSKKESDGGQVNLLIKFIASLYIRPNKAKSDIHLVSHEVIESEEGEKLLKLLIENRGSAHNLLRNPKLDITAQNESVTLLKDDLKILANQNMLAQHTRQFLLPLPGEFTDQAVMTDFSFDQR